VGDGTVRKSVGESGEFLCYRPSVVTFLIQAYLRVSDIAAFVLQHATFLHPTSSPPNSPIFQ